MRTIKALNEIKNINRKVYVRWSKSIGLDSKRGYSLRSGTQAEAGLSACEIDTEWEDWRILRQLVEYMFCGGSCWIVTGDETGRGADNEPLLANIALVGKVSDALLGIDWAEMKKDAEIIDYRNRLTYTTDPIGRQIIEGVLAKLQK